MKHLSKFVLAVIAFFALLFTLPSAVAQGGRGFDTYAVPRYFIVASGQYTNSLANQSTGITYSNGIVDIRNCAGIMSILLSITNTAGTTPVVYARLEGSNDQTNWYTLTNTSLASASSVVITNMGWANTNVQAQNNYLLPGTMTTATPATAGFAGSYLVPTAFSSTAVLCTNSSGTIALMGFNVGDAPRYIHLLLTIGGTNASFVASCVAIANREWNTP